MSDYKLYSFIGLERCDIVYILSIMVEKILPESSVLVIDNSSSHDLFSSVCNNDNTSIQRGSITYLRDTAYSHQAFNHFDYIFCYMGWNYNQELLENSTNIFVTTDYTKHCYRRLRELPIVNASNCNLIFREKVTGKIAEKQIAEKLSLQDVPMYVFPFEMKDYLMYIMLNHNGKQKLKGYSQEFKENIRDILEQTFLFQLKDIKRCIKH